MEEIQTGLESAFRTLDQQISLWISNVVFQGSSFGLALKTILQTQTQSQQRLKLKWQQLNPQNSRGARLGLLKKMKMRSQ